MRDCVVFITDLDLAIDCVDIRGFCSMLLPPLSLYVYLEDKKKMPSDSGDGRNGEQCER